MKISGRNGNDRKFASIRNARTDVGTHPASVHRPADDLAGLRVEKVGEIQSAMESGNYRVEGQKVADKMVTDAVREIRNRTRETG